MTPFGTLLGTDRAVVRTPTPASVRQDDSLANALRAARDERGAPGKI
jgi:hypothetical protein